LAEDKKKEGKEDKTAKYTVSELKDRIEKAAKNAKDSEKNKKTVEAINRFFKDYEALLEEKDRAKVMPDFKKKMFRGMEKDNLKAYIGNPHKTFTLIDEKYSQNIEPAYFWVLGFMKDDLKIEKIEKVVDTYTASEASAFAKSMGQSLSAIQDRVSGHMRTIGQLVKELFQMVREIRILDERLELYEEGEKVGNKKENAAEITLKGMYIDLVEGGAQSPSSVYGLATKVGFALLPDLFFRTHIIDPDKVGDEVAKMQFNEKVKEILSRKLRAYAGWRKTTYTTLKHRKNFMVSYMKQHYNAILLNVQWIKPYLKTVKRLTSKPGGEEMPDIVAAIEQAYMEIQILANIETYGNYNSIVDVSFKFRTSPEMMYDSQNQYRKPSHTGRVEMVFSARAMTDDQILAYKTSLELEDFEMIGAISNSIKEAMDALGDDLKKYLEEAEGKVKKDELKLKEEHENINVFEPFVEIFKGFRSVYYAFGFPEFKGKEETSKWQSDKDFKAAKTKSTKQAFLCFWIYKKSHRMITW